MYYAALAATAAVPVADDAEQWLQRRFGVVRGHPEWRALVEAFNAGRAAPAAPSVPAQALTDAQVVDEVAWLVEKFRSDGTSTGCYMAGYALDAEAPDGDLSITTTTDPTKARRYRRMRTAEFRAADAQQQHGGVWRATQHAFIGAGIPAPARVALTEPTDEEIGHVTIEQARAALDSLDDFARMRTSVDAMGPRRTLEVFIKQAAASPARVALTDAQIVDLWSWSATAEAERTASTQQHAFARAIEHAHGIQTGTDGGQAHG